MYALFAHQYHQDPSVPSVPPVPSGSQYYAWCSHCLGTLTTDICALFTPHVRTRYAPYVNHMRITMTPITPLTHHKRTFCATIVGCLRVLYLLYRRHFKILLYARLLIAWVCSICAPLATVSVQYQSCAIVRFIVNCFGNARVRCFLPLVLRLY